MRQPDYDAINPSVNELQIGVRDRRTIQIYPLSMAHHKKLGKLVAESAQMILNSAQGVDDAEILSIAITKIIDNVWEIAKMACPDEDTSKLEEDMTFPQLTDFAKIVFYMNFSIAIKNVQSLFQETKQLFQWERQSPSSAKNTDTDPNDSLSSDTKKGD